MLNIAGNGPSGYTISNSLRFRGSALAYLERTPASSGNKKTWTWSGWVKRGDISTDSTIFGSSDTPSSGVNMFVFRFYSDATLYVRQTNSSGTAVVEFQTTAVFRDPSAWYHVVLSMDTTQSTDSNGLKIYVNNVLQTGTFYAYTQNYDTSVNSTSYANYIGKWSSNSPQMYLDGYLAEVNFIDGQALTPSSFGESDATTGVWKAKKYTGTYGTNGFYLKFSDIATTSGSNAGLGKDFSGNGNYWNTNNISVTAGTTYDAMTDVPTLTSATVANYAVMNPLNSSIFIGSLTYSNANLTLLAPGFSGTNSTIFVNSGKWYAEVTIGERTGDPVTTVGIGTNTSQYYAGNSSDSYAYRNDGQKMNNYSDGDPPSSYGASYTTGDIIGIALDMDAGTLTFYKNNTSQGTAFTGLSGTFGFRLGNSLSSTSTTFNINFGQRPFTYTPPSGYKALNTFNLPDSTIKKGNTVMDATLYTGDSSYPRSLTNTAGFKPDLVWTKARNQTYSHVLYDSVRGTGTGAALFSDLTAAEGSNSGNVNLTSFNSNGWSVGSTSSTNILNNSAITFVGWQWQAGQGSSSSNTSGSITSTVSVNATAGFSVVTYTGNSTTNTNYTIGHGLGVAPKMVIIKSRTWAASSSAWPVWHTSSPTALVYLDDTGSASSGDYGYFMGSTAPTSSVFTVRCDTTPSTGARFRTFGAYDYVAYCWAEIAGFSKFGSYTGNGSADGPFVYLGFRPKFVIIKCTNDISHWTIEDTAENPYNVAVNSLYSDTSAAQNTTVMSLDFLSNGFKCRNVLANESNVNGYTYIYAAFAESPFKSSLAR